MPKLKQTELIVSEDTNLYARVEKTHTTKIGDDYAKVSVALQMHFNPSREEIRAAEDTMRIVSELVEEKLLEELKNLGVA